VKAALAQVTRFEFPQYVDLRQLMSRLWRDSQLPAAARTDAASVVSALDQAMLAKMQDERQPGGMSIYAPTKATDEMPHINLFTEWNTVTGWGTLVNRILGRAPAARSPNTVFHPYSYSPWRK